MLCCVSKKSAAGGLDAAELTLDRCSRVASLILVNHASDSHSNSKSHPVATGNGTREREEREEQEDLAGRLALRETADAATILLPCAICARTFKPQSLEKHRRICERSALKKRKPFDSAKQRIQGTELAEFAPRREPRRPSQDGTQERIRDRSPKSKSAWKQTHDQLLLALREARRENVDVPPRRQKTAAATATATTTTTTTTAPVSMTSTDTLSVSSGAPTRANEKGTCPTCSRQFGIKAYDRHVAWCKERAIRLPLSPATNVAKERLEARMKYRAPILKNRRAFNREKYSPGSAVNFNAFGCKTSPTSPTSTTSSASNSTAAKESLSMPACNKIQETVLNPKQTVSATTSRRLSHGGKPIAAPITSMLPCNASVIDSSKYCPVDRKNRKVREDISLASKYVCKSEKSKPKENGTVRLNDVTVNEGVIGMTVRPCNVYRISHFDIDAGSACKRTANVTEPTMPQRDCGTIADERCDEANSPDHSPRRTSSRISEDGSSERDTVVYVCDDEGLDLTYSIIHSLDGDRHEDQDRANETGDIIDTTIDLMAVKESRQKEETRTLETTEEHLPLIQGSATRCATYVIEETSGERKVHSQSMETLGKNRQELEGTVAITTSEESARPRVCPKYVNGNFECPSEEESLGEREAVTTKTTGSTGRRIVGHLRKDFDSWTASARVTDRQIRERMKALRGSTDSLISSIERTDRTKRASRVAPTEAADQAERDLEHLPAIVPNYVRRQYASGNLMKSNGNSSYWVKVSKVVESRREVKSTEPLTKQRLLIRNRKIQDLPPVIPSPKTSQPNFHSDIGTSAEPVVSDLQSDDPFYLAERQMNELSSTDAPDRSIDQTIITDHSPSALNSNFPLSRSPSAFVKYAGHSNLNRDSSSTRSLEKRSSVIAPPSQFDDLTSSEFSSDSTETNSLSREIYAEAFRESAASRQHRVVIDKSRPSTNLDANSSSGRAKTFVNSRKILEQVSGKIVRPTVNRSQSVRSTSAPRQPVSQERNRSLGSGKKGNLHASGPAAVKAAADQISNGKKKVFVCAKKNHLPTSSSNLSLSSIVSSELDVKRSNSMLEDFTSSFEDDAASSSYPLLRSFLKTDLTSALSSPIDRSDRTNARRNSEDEEENLSSPDSYKRHDSDRAKQTVDSAYSSLNRKYSNHGRSGEDVVAHGSRRFYEEDVETPRCKMSKFCHECGSRFPETAKFCCECGVRRLAF